MYSMLIQQCSTHVRNTLFKWFQKLNIHPAETEKTCCKIWKNVYAVTDEMKLREFQWKLLHRLLPCNKYLYFWKKKDSMDCSVCHQVDSLEHKFLYCQIAEKYWKRVKNIAAKLTGETIEITAENIIFTELVTTVSLHVNCRVIQLLSLLGKWSIHKCWVTGMNTPIEIILKNEFVLRYNFEKEVHKRVDVLEVFEQSVNLVIFVM